MTTSEIVGRELAACDLTGDGRFFRLGFIGENGEPGFLSLPADCVKSLIMTLPRVMEQSQRLRYRDNSLRLVFRAHGLRVELASDLATFIVTLTTEDGFAVSFALDDQQIRSFSEALGQRDAAAATAPKAN